MAAGDVVILAEETLKIAVGEEDVADAFGACDGGFFAAMGANGGHFGHEGSMTET